MHVCGIYRPSRVKLHNFLNVYISLVSHQKFPSIHFKGAVSRLLSATINSSSVAIKKLPELIPRGFPRSSALWKTPLLGQGFLKCGPRTACIRMPWDTSQMPIPWLLPDLINGHHTGWSQEILTGSPGQSHSQ